MVKSTDNGDTEGKQLKLNSNLDQPIPKTGGSKDSNHLADGTTASIANQQTPASKEAEMQEFFIPISGFVWLYPEERRILDHPAVQRLGRINQLGQANLVYRGATHKRLEHTLRTVHVAQLMIDAVSQNAEKAREKNEVCGALLQTAERRFVRLGALLHDIGHIVAGHTIEDEMCLVCKHDSDERLDKLLIDERKVWIDREELSLGKLVDREYQKYLPLSLHREGITPSEVVRLLIRKPPTNDAEDRFKTKQGILANNSEIRLNVCRDIIGNTICADLLDYLHRDWYHTGKMRTFDDRLLQYMEIRPKETPINKLEPVPKPTDQFLVCLGKRPKIRTDAVSQILELLEWRYQLAESVLFHRTKLAAEAMLDRALYEIWGSDAASAEMTLIELGDDELYVACRRIAETKGEKGAIPVKLLRALENRQLFAPLCTYSWFDLPSDALKQIQEQFSSESENPSPSSATKRNNLLRLLENDFVLKPGSLAMFCPGGSMKAKVADVVVQIGDEACRFSEYERGRDEPLSAGHLVAQISRFQRLWRVHFFIDREEKNRINPWIGELKDAIFKLGLGQLQPHEYVDGTEPIARRIALSMTAKEGSPWHGHPLREQAVTAAYRDANAATGMYPFGANSIRSYIENEPSEL